MSGGFTPGPWAWSPSFDFGRDITGDLFGLGGEKVISSAAYEGMWFAAYDAPKDAANARLIAAAPDLYEACEAAFDLISKSRLPDKGATHAEASLRLALAKARGTITSPIDARIEGVDHE